MTEDHVNHSQVGNVFMLGAGGLVGRSAADPQVLTKSKQWLPLAHTSVGSLSCSTFSSLQQPLPSGVQQLQPSNHLWLPES